MVNSLLTRSETAYNNKSMDALSWVKTTPGAVEELKARLAQATDKNDKDHYGKTPEQIASKFLDDQGHKFGSQVDLKPILALAK